MKLSDDLNDLIESARTDGKLSEKERQVIIKKAVNEGHDKDEFEIYFEGIIQQAEKAKKKQLLNNFSSFFGLIWKFRKYAAGVIFICFLLAYTYSWEIQQLFEEKEEQLITSERGCENVEDCLTKSKFEEARLYASESLGRVGRYDYKIVKSEISYYLSSGDYEIAYRIFNEYTHTPEIGICLEEAIMDGYYSNSNEGYIKDSKKYNTLIELLIPYFEDDKIKLRMLVNSLYPECEMGKTTGKKTGNGYLFYTFNKNNNLQKTLLKKYNLK